MTLTGKTIGELTNLVNPTAGTLIPVEASGNTYNIDYSVIRPYKVYSALLTQTGTNPPVATVLENTLGANITYIRTTNGRYNVNCDATIFNPSKTGLIVGSSCNTLFGQYSLIYNGGNNQLFLATSDGGGITMDDILYDTLIEIRVYN